MGLLCSEAQLDWNGILQDLEPKELLSPSLSMQKYQQCLFLDVYVVTAVYLLLKRIHKAIMNTFV